MEFKYYLGIDEIKIPYLEFLSKRNISKAKILIIHGMGEHIKRYVEFGEFLSSNGYDAYVVEYRGHGELKVSEYFDFGSLQLDGVVKDINRFIIDIMKEKYENIILFGHSLGVEIVSKIAIENDVKKIILSGIPHKSFLNFGMLISYLEYKLLFKKRSILEKTFEHYNKHFSPNRTDVDWLSRDNRAVDEYIADDLCGITGVTPKFYNEIFKLMKYNLKKIRNINKNSNILLLYGTDDPCTAYGKSVKKLSKNLKRKKRRIKIIKNDLGRHESLNEINKYQIYDEILKWLNEQTTKK